MPARREPLARSGSLRRTAIRRTPREPAVPTDIRDALAERSDGLCEIQLSYRDHRCQGVATEPHHRLPRGSGGVFGVAAVRANRLSNLLDSCRLCNEWCDDNRSHAEMRGLLLRHGQDPAAEWVVRRGVHVFLDDAGGTRRASHIPASTWPVCA